MNELQVQGCDNFRMKGLSSSAVSQSKVRRRQSDARWRASLSGCYDILKHIMPAAKRANKRQISKAIILKETARHIDFLESMVVTLLQEKAEKQGVKNINSWCVRKVNQLQESFIVAQTQRNSKMASSRRRVTSNQRHLSESTRFLCSGLDKEDDNPVDRPVQKRRRTRRTTTTSQILPTTPKKNEHENEQALGFTPVKLPSTWCWGQTPSKNLETLEPVSEYPIDASSSPHFEDYSQETGVQHLLCTERICLSDDEDACISKNNQTPKSKKSNYDSCQLGPRKTRYRREDTNAAPKTTHSIDDYENIVTDNQHVGNREAAKCCRSLNLSDAETRCPSDEDEEGESLFDTSLCVVSLQDAEAYWTTEETSVPQISGAELCGDIVVPLNVLNEFDADFCIFDSEFSLTMQCKDNSPMLSQTSEFTVNVDDQFYTVASQGNTSASASSENEFVSAESQDCCFAQNSDSEMMDESDIGSEYPGQYSPLFGRGIACLLGI